MLPPPITRASSRPSWRTSRISAAIDCSTRLSMPYAASPMRASPLSLSMTRRYRRCWDASRPAGPISSRASMRSSVGARLFAQLETCEAAHDDVFAQPRHRVRDELADLLVGILDERLLEQACIGVELLHLAADHLVDHLCRLAAVRRLGHVDAALLLEHLGRHLLTPNVARVGGRDLHRQLLHQVLEVVGARDEVGLAVHLDEHADLAAGMDVRRDDAVGGGAAGALRGSGQ